MRWDTVLFDLDGTVTDSQEGIVNSVSYALKRLGREVPSPDMLPLLVFSDIPALVHSSRQA